MYVLYNNCVCINTQAFPLFGNIYSSSNHRKFYVYWASKEAYLFRATLTKIHRFTDNYSIPYLSTSKNNNKGLLVSRGGGGGGRRNAVKSQNLHEIKPANSELSIAVHPSNFGLQLALFHMAYAGEQGENK